MTHGPLREAQDGTASLPPGQRRIAGFPRFGTHLHRPPPPVPADPAIEIDGAGIEPFGVPLAELMTLPRREVTADFHCVAGWSATGLRWEGVAFATVYRRLIEPSPRPGTTITHVLFGGLDGHESVMLLDDALGEDVLIADQLDGQKLGADHGAPARLVCPEHYGYVNTKHLCHIELHTSEPKVVGSAHPLSQFVLRGPFVMRHPRARVAQEERHPYLPAWLLRPFYRRTIPGGVRMGSGSSRRSA